MIYVDDMNLPAEVPNGRVVHKSRWSHLFNDGPDEELHAFAARLGLRRSYFQHPGEWQRHYDVTEGKRWQVIRLGAQPVSPQEGTRILRARDTDQRAGESYKTGELLRAAQMIQEARQEYPEREELWTQRMGRITSAIRAANRADDPSVPLDELAAKREERHGITPDDLARREIADWNSAQILRAVPEIASHLAGAERLQAAQREAGQ